MTNSAGRLESIYDALALSERTAVAEMRNVEAEYVRAERWD
jgi:hypothetical protein